MGADLRREDVLQPIYGLSRRFGARKGSKLLQRCIQDQRVSSLSRKGKQFALTFENGIVLAVHLGMTGQMRLLTTYETQNQLPTHSHLVLHLHDNNTSTISTSPLHTIVFRDPRRFGRLWLFKNNTQLATEKWDKLGEDALQIQTRQLHPKLHKTKRSIKATLLDQNVIAGLGNIYVDELLFQTGIAPWRVSCEISEAECDALVKAMRVLLERAIDAGGSSLRDYVNGHGDTGQFQTQHKVYGKKSGEPCVVCKGALTQMVIAGRTTVYCKNCQPL